MAFYGRPRLPFARPKTLHKTPKRPLPWLLIGFQRPHPWLFMGVQACRLPGLKPSKPQTPKTPKRPLQWLLMGFQRRQKPTSMAFYGRPSLPFARPKTLQTPKTPKTLNPKTPKRPLRRSSVPLARHSQPTGIRHQAFKPAVYYFFPSQRRP